jgi:hypothetical protein
MSVRYTRKDGKPSSYEFSCGAVYQKNINQKTVQIYKQFLTFHIVTFVPNLNNSNQNEYIFGCTDNLKDAWKAFNNQLKYIKSIKE